METGWETLSKRRENQRLVLFYKIVNGLSPPHLHNIYMQYLRHDEARYFFRNDNIPTVYARTETYRRSFFPSVIRSWNNLDPSIRNIGTLGRFKSSLRAPSRVKNLYLSIGSRQINCILTCIRMKCSQLRSDLFINNIIDNKNCTCGSEENALHFFLECPNYNLFRNTLIIDTSFITLLTVDTILNGDDSLSRQDNVLLHKAVSKFILSTNRFTIIT